MRNEATRNEGVHRQVVSRGRASRATSRLLTGAVIGAGLALLFAPRKGAELRSELRASVSAASARVARRYQTIAESAGRGVGTLERQIDRVAGRPTDDSGAAWRFDAPPLPPPHAVSEHS